MLTENEKCIYRNQISMQINYCDIALNTIEYCLNSKENKSYLAFFCVQGLLVSLANISKLFDIESKCEFKKNRADILVKEFNIDLSNFPIMRNRKLRNANEHFDEILDTYFKLTESERAGFNDCNIGTISKNGESAGFCNSNAIYFRHIDDVKREILFADNNIKKINSIKLNDVRKELEELKNLIIINQSN